MSDETRVAFGLPLYNHARHVAEALESILGQRFGDFVIVAADDCSEDETLEIVREYAERDPRIVHVSRNRRRLGMIGNFRRVFSLAAEYCPEAEYFAWGSDHDMWHPYWLESMVEALDDAPRAVLAYPVYLKVSEAGIPRSPGGWTFDTADEPDRRKRLRRVQEYMSAGNMIYGLYRREALQRAGVKRRVLLPDRLLMAELALYGRFVQVPEILWYRRHYRGKFSVGRQRRSLFGSRRPLWVWLPWWIGHGAALFGSLVWQGRGQPEIGRAEGLRHAIASSLLGCRAQVDRLSRRIRDRLKQRRTS